MTATADLGFVPDASEPGLGFIPDKPTPQVDLGFVPDKNPGGLSDTELQRVLALVSRAAKPAPDDLLVPDIQRENARQVALDQPFAAVGPGGKIFQETPQNNPEANRAEFAKLWQAPSDITRADLTDAVTTALLPVTYPLYGVQGVVGMEASLPAAIKNAFRNTETNPGPESLPVDAEIAQMSGEHPILATIAKVGQSTAGALPLVVGAGAAPAWAGRLMSLGFTAQMIADAGPAARTLGTELGKNPEDRDNDQITSAAADLVQDFGFAPFVGLHGTRDIVERYADKPMYAIRQLSERLQNAPIVRTASGIQPGADISPFIRNAVPPLSAAKVHINSLLEKPISQKIDDLRAVIGDIKAALTANQIVPKHLEQISEFRNEMPASGNLKSMQDIATSVGPAASENFQGESHDFDFQPAGNNENNLTPNQIQQSIRKAINEKYAKINVADADSPERITNVVRRQAESAYSKVRQGRAILANTAHDSDFYNTDLGRRLQAIAGQNALRVVFYKGDTGSPKGFFNPQDGNLYLRTNVPVSELGAILEHEAFHQRVAAGDIAAKRVASRINLNSLSAQKIAAKYNSWLAMHGKPPLSSEKLKEEIGAFHVSGQSYEGIAPSDAFGNPAEALTAATEYHARLMEGPNARANRTSFTNQTKIPTIGGRRPINSKYAGRAHPLGVNFSRQAFADFSPYAIVQVKVGGLTGRYARDEILANKAAGLKKTPAGYVWHHVHDGKTMQLVPRRIHKARHTGGSAVIRNGGFDK
jgi:hypothetical protein